MQPTTNPDHHILALDLGEKRVGVASASLSSLLPKPLVTLNNDEHLISDLKKLINELQVKTVVIGVPRSLNAQDTPQTKKILKTINQLEAALNFKAITQDEALSSVRAEDELKSRGKIFSKADVDKLAACLILEDYIKGLDQ